MIPKLQYTIFIKRFIEKKLKLKYSLYIDEKTRNILDFTTHNDELSYESVYKKIMEIERKLASNEPSYQRKIWETITNTPIIQTMILYYIALVEYHYNDDIYYEEDHQELTDKLFTISTKNTCQNLGNIGNISSTIIQEFIQISIDQYAPPSPKNNSSHKSYTCISKYYPYFFEYTFHIKKTQNKYLPEKIHKSEQETIAYILSWMQ
jgi:hypothetical protein